METEDSSTAAETSESSEAAAAPAAESESNPEADKPATEDKPDAASPDSKAKEGEEKSAAPEEKKPRKPKVKTIDLDVVGQTSSLEKTRINTLTEKELQLIANDRLEGERQHAKNAVEEYVYEIRDKLHGDYEQYITEAAKDEFSAILSSTEDWLYDEGEDEKKQVYIDRLTDMKKRGDPVAVRCKEDKTRAESFDQFWKAIIHIQKFIGKFREGDELYNHLTEEEVSKVEKSLAEKQDWYNKQHTACINLKKTDDPPVLTSQIITEKNALEKAVKSTMTKPKPKVEPPKEEAKPAGDDSQANTNTSNSNDSGDSTANGPTSNGAGDKGTEPTPEAADMEVD